MTKTTKEEKINKHHWLIIDKLKYPPRILGYNNTLEFVNVRRYKKGISLYVSLIPENLKLTDLGYTDEWSKRPEHNKVIEQMRIIISEEDSRKLLEDLKKKIK